jgi:hypothetical protein
MRLTCSEFLRKKFLHSKPDDDGDDLRLILFFSAVSLHVHMDVHAIMQFSFLVNNV